jgi:hypothetical protein
MPTSAASRPLSLRSPWHRLGLPVRLPVAGAVRRAAKIDGNHAAIVAGLRSVGASVTPLHAVGEGCPDLLVGFRDANYVIEVKDGSLAPSERLLTPKQKKWHAEWRGKAHVANSLMEALLIIGARSQ